jgi:hypothetical protein
VLTTAYVGAPPEKDGGTSVLWLIENKVSGDRQLTAAHCGGT